MKRLVGGLVIALVLIFSLAASAAAAPDQIGNIKAHTNWHLKPKTNYLAATGYSPTQVVNAYNLQSAGGGAGTTIAIVDAYDNPNAAADLDAFSDQFGLPLTSSGFFTKHKMTSSVQGDTGWGVEIALDIQWAHAIAPKANILLVEAASASLSDLLSAVNYAKLQTNVVAVSTSWGTGDFLFESLYDSYFSSNHGEIYFASSGDSGGAVIWPSASPNVVSVGGTTLNLDASGNVISETGWSGSGGGTSKYESEPSYQSTYGIPGAGGARGTPDVSYDADPNTGFPVYDTYGYGGWLQVGGTSAGAPQWAAIQALGLSSSNPTFYKDAKSSSYSAYFRDITAGSAGRNSAAPGYDYVTGLGSPLTTSFSVAPTSDFSLAASPSSLTVNQGGSGTSTISVTALNGFNGPVSFSTSGLPNGVSASFNPPSVTGSGSSTLTLTADSTATTGTSTLTVTGTSGSLTHTTSLTLTVAPAATPDFSLAASPSSLTVNQGNSGTSLISVTALNGFSGNVGFSTSGLPNGVSASFNPTSVTGSGSSTLTLTAGSTATTGTSTLTVTGTSGSLMHTTSLTLTVAPAATGDFSISVSPSTRSVKSGTVTSYSVSLTSISGYNSTVDLTVAGASGSFNPTSADLSSGNATSTLTVNTDGMSKGTYTLNITGTSADATITHSVTVSLKIR